MSAGEGRDREDLAAFLLRLRAAQITEPRLMEAIETVPRRLFVPPALDTAYGDRSLPIDCGETMPGALFAAWLVHALKIEAGHRILEIGTGSGYVTALLARLGGKVVSMDRYRRLLGAADQRLRRIGAANVTLVREDGRAGYGRAAPFDRILVHAALEAAPRQFLEQLAAQGMMICAIGPGEGPQMLVRLNKVGSRFEREDLRSVHYQPLAFGTAAVL